MASGIDAGEDFGCSRKHDFINNVQQANPNMCYYLFKDSVLQSM